MSDPKLTDEYAAEPTAGPLGLVVIAGEHLAAAVTAFNDAGMVAAAHALDDILAALSTTTNDIVAGLTATHRERGRR